MINPCELLDLSVAGLLVETFGVTLLGGVDRTFDLYEDKLAFVFDDLPGPLLGVTERCYHPDDGWDIIAIQ
jgi:hypothetical protein